MTFTDREPAITAASVTALAAAVLALLVAFGVQITPQQRDAFLGLLAVLAPLWVALLVRPHVTPNARIMEAVADETVKQRDTEIIHSA